MFRPRLGELKLSIRNLIAEFGHTDNLLFGVLLSIALALPGVAVWFLLSGWVAWIGAVWALLNLLPILQAVMQL